MLCVLIKSIVNKIFITDRYLIKEDFVSTGDIEFYTCYELDLFNRFKELTLIILFKDHHSLIIEALEKGTIPYSLKTLLLERIEESKVYEFL